VLRIDHTASPLQTDRGTAGHSLAMCMQISRFNSKNRSARRDRPVTRHEYRYEPNPAIGSLILPSFQTTFNWTTVRLPRQRWLTGGYTAVHLKAQKDKTRRRRERKHRLPLYLILFLSFHVTLLPAD